VELDFDQIARWFEARGTKMPPRSLFPRSGFIIDDVAAGFLYFTDSTVAIIDSYVSNPLSEPKTRSDALDAITLALIGFARFHGVKLVKCDTKLEVIKTRALGHGFKATGSYESFALEL
jgi:hypothetical protein